MAKKIKLDIKNTQIAKALNLDSVKDKLSKKKVASEEISKTAAKKPALKKAKAQGPEQALPLKAKKEAEAPIATDEQLEDKPKIRARTHSHFTSAAETEASPIEQEEAEETLNETDTAEFMDLPDQKNKALLLEETQEKAEEVAVPQESLPPEPQVLEQKAPPVAEVKLGPTGRHISDFLPKKKPKIEEEARPSPARQAEIKTPEELKDLEDRKKIKTGKAKDFKEFKDVKPKKKTLEQFDSRDRLGLRSNEDELRWRKRKQPKQRKFQEDLTIRPTELKVRLPISIKDLAAEMKLKTAQLIEKLFLQGRMMTINDFLDDETELQLLGQEFGCAITIDTSEEERIRITDLSVNEEISQEPVENLSLRAPIVTFMGHVDHGKTSLIDAIRKSNVASGEAGAITQHIGAFKTHTEVGDITILDTPGHEAFSAMRARGANVTDIVVLVVAGDEGIRQQTVEAIQHAKAAGVTIVVAINKCDKPNFDPETVYRQLAEQELLPESWGGQTITVNCSAKTGQGIRELLEMLALQAEVLELRANASKRARGIVLESQMHKGLGAVATVLVLNGTLRFGDSLVFDTEWGKVKTMKDEQGKSFIEATPATPVAITGLSNLPEAGQEFIVVANEKEAKDIAEVRATTFKEGLQKQKNLSLDKFLEVSPGVEKKILNVVLRADVQGSLEALKTALMKIESDKVTLNVIFSGVGEVSESDVQLAAASNAVIVGFHTRVESHAEALTKQYGVKVTLHDVIYHAIDAAKALMTGTLDRIAEEMERGQVEIRAVFKSSHLGTIAGCYVTEGSVHRNWKIHQFREGNEIWKGEIRSLKRLKDDVKEVQKGFECGIVLGSSDIQVGDILKVYEIMYREQKL